MRLIILACSALIVACSTTPQHQTDCGQKDWYEIGRNDGAQGTSLEEVKNHRMSCPSGFKGDQESMYLNGRNAGLVEFCDGKNAYEMGRMGTEYNYVCPSTMETGFLNSYRRGQQARKIEIENQKLDAAIDSLLAKLDKADSGFERRKLASEVDSLKKTRVKNERELNRVSK